MLEHHIERMSDKILNEIAEMRHEIRELRDCVVRLETSWNGGPGTWHICQAHVEEIHILRDAKQFVERKIWAAMGVLSLLVMLAGIFGPAISERIGATMKPQQQQQRQQSQQQKGQQQQPQRPAQKAPAIPTNNP